MKGVAVALLWRVILLVCLADVVYRAGYEHGELDTEAFYSDDDWSADPEGSTDT